MKGISLTKAERLAKTKGIRGWGAMLCLLCAMCFDQFVLQIPFANVVFPILVICAACMSPAKNAVLVLAYSIIFELSCIAWMPSELYRAQWWLLEVILGYFMPFICYKVFNRQHKDISVLSYAAIASLSQLMYYLVSVVATAIIWRLPLGAYLLSDLPYELAGCGVTLACTMPIALIYKLTTGELKLKGTVQPVASLEA